MINSIEKYIRHNNMIAPGDVVLVGVSGGADSVCLLVVLCRLQTKLDFKVKALHVNHMLRGKEADEDEQYVASLCHRLGVELSIEHIDVKGLARTCELTLEEAGRKARYEAFNKLPGVSKIAVAHHMDDQAETFIHNIARGSGIKGAGGMRPVRDNIIRPLLCVARSEIEEFLHQEGISYCTDRSNLSNDYTRNKIRNIVLPCIRDNINENAIANINYLSQDLRETYEYMQQMLLQYKKEYVTAGAISKNVKAIAKIMRRMLIKDVLEDVAGTSKDITREHIEAVEELIYMEPGKKVSLPYNMLAVSEYDSIIIGTGSDIHGSKEYLYQDCEPQDFVMEICDYDEPWEKITNDYTKVFDYDKIKGNVEIRKRAVGDYLTVDSKGSKKSLKEYFINQKIPSYLREDIWLIACGSEVLWVVGYRTSMKYNVDSETKRILKITIRRK